VRCSCIKPFIVKPDANAFSDQHLQPLCFPSYSDPTHFLEDVRTRFWYGYYTDFIFAKHSQALPDYQLDKVNVYALHSYQAAVPIGVTMAIEAIAKRLG
jgi:hypothetical protein